MKLIAVAVVLMLAQASRADDWPFPFSGFPGAFGSKPAKTAAPEKLPNLHADPAAVSVSGVSAGAFMATQLQVAFSASIMGVGSIAGGPWSCAQGSVLTAQTACMYDPNEVDTKQLIHQTRLASRAGQIDNISHLKSTRVYAYNSSADDVVRPPMSEKTNAYFAAFVPATNLKIETSIPSAHGFPTLDFGNACDTQGAPYLNKCNFDAAGALLQQIYSARTLVRAAANPASLRVIDQTEFGADAAALASTGWAYIPAACRTSRASCPVHVALHGCLQAGEAVKDVFVAHAGYNEWAEGSNLIILYPQTQKSFENPNGCFDWWGYTGADYALKSGVQMKAMKAMIDRVSGI